MKLALTIPVALLATPSLAWAKSAPSSDLPQKKPPPRAQASGTASAVIVSDVVRIALDNKGRVLPYASGHYTRSVDKDGTQLINLQ